jgi:hypothetical protein
VYTLAGHSKIATLSKHAKKRERITRSQSLRKSDLVKVDLAANSVKATGTHGRVVFASENENRLFHLPFNPVLKGMKRRFLRIIRFYDQAF